MRRFFRCSVRQFMMLALAVGLLLVVIAPQLRQKYVERSQERADGELLNAAEAGDVEGVSEAIAAGADILAWDERRCSALGFAIRNGNLAMLDVLLIAGADPDMNGLGDLTPLEQAAREDYPAAIAMLLRAGATRNRDKAITACIVNDRPDALRALLEVNPTAGLLRTAMECDLPDDRKLAMVRRLLEWGAPPDKPFHAMYAAGSRPIDLALQNQDAGLADLLREFGVPYTPREAVVLGRSDEVRRMVEEDRSLIRQRFPPYSYVESPDRYPTLLGLALREGHREIARYLLDAGAPIDGLEWYDETMLVQAIVGNDPEMIKELASRGLPVNSDDPRNAPLFHASWRGNTVAVATLIELGADVKQPGPLHRAAYHNFPQIAKLLVDSGADTTLVDDQGHTPREAAELRGSVAVVKMLDAATESQVSKSK